MEGNIYYLQPCHFQFEAGQKSGRNSDLFSHGRSKAGIQPLDDGLLIDGRRRPPTSGVTSHPANRKLDLKPVFFAYSFASKTKDCSLRVNFDN